MRDVFFILGRAALCLTTPEHVVRGVLLANKEIRAEVLAHVEVLKLEKASKAAIATVFCC